MATRRAPVIRKASSGYRAVICDLGGVVVRIDSDRVRQRWASLSDLPDAASLAPYPDATYEAFERGDVTEAEYFAHVRSTLQCHENDEQLLDGFNDLFLGVDHDVVQQLRELRDQGVLVIALTNTNVAHQRVWARRFADELAVFERVHCSHELGARKPEPAAFEQVLAAHALDGRETVFIDDVPDYVDAAATLGMHGILFETAPALARDLDRLSWNTAAGSSSKPRR